MEKVKNVSFTIKTHNGFQNYPSIIFKFISPISQNDLVIDIINTIDCVLSDATNQVNFVTRINRSKNRILSWGLRFDRHKNIEILKKLRDEIEEILN